MPTKTCTACRKELPATADHWHLAAKGKYGLAARCKPCKMAEINRTNTPEKKKDWYQQNRPKVLKRVAAYRNSRTPEDRAQAFEYHREYRYANGDKLNALNRRWRSENIDRARMNGRAKEARRRARKAECPGTHTAADIKAQFRSQRGKCYWCSVALNKYHVDHLIPLARGGGNGPENIVLACPSCNFSKGAKMPWEWKAPRLR